ncbi:hypothetical protein FB99_16760 [Pantoea agglomerans]|nr:hypothetical protein FB99_16760 [Pantoea agglomerans]
MFINLFPANSFTGNNKKRVQAGTIKSFKHQRHRTSVDEAANNNSRAVTFPISAIRVISEQS